MFVSRSVLPLILAGALVGAVTPAVCHAGEGLTPRPQKVFEDRPRIEDYTDYGAFLVDIMEYRRQKAERDRQRAVKGPQDASQPDDPYRITGAESLDEALERARHLAHPAYQEPLRFDRTTSQSFPLEPMQAPEMSVSELPGVLADPAAGQVVVYEDGTTEKKVRKAVDAADEEDEKNRKTKATAESFAVTRAGVAEDLAGNWVRDADGRLYRLQVGDISNQNQQAYSYGSGDFLINRLEVDLVVERRY